MNELNIKIAKKVYGRKIILLNRFGGLYPYVYDETAKENDGVTTTNLIGGNWMQAENENGEVVEVFAKPITNYERYLDAVHEVEEEIIRLGKEKDYVKELKKILNTDDEFKLIHTTAEQKCRAILNTIKD